MERLQIEEEKLRLMVFKSALELGKKVDEHLLDMYGFDKEKVFSLMMVNGCSSWDFMENFIFDRNDTFQIEQK